MDFLPTPCQCVMQLSTDGAILAMAVAHGYEGHDPILRYHRLGDDGDVDCDAVHMDPWLSNVARWKEMDSERKLIFLADDDRIKSFSWGPNADNELTKVLPNVHTMNSEREYDGPLAVLPGGRLIRAGKGKVAVWNLDTLETHQDNPGKLIGEGTLNMDNCSREEDWKHIERSSGSTPNLNWSIVVFSALRTSAVILVLWRSAKILSTPMYLARFEFKPTTFERNTCSSKKENWGLAMSSVRTK